MMPSNINLSNKKKYLSKISYKNKYTNNFADVIESMLILQGIENIFQ